MNLILAAGLLLGTPIATDAHRVEIDHKGQRVDVTYRSDVAVKHKQIGAAGPGCAVPARLGASGHQSFPL